MIPPARLHIIAAVLLLSACGERATTRTDSASSSPFHLADSLRDGGRLLEALTTYRGLRDSFARATDSANLWRAQLWWSDALRRLGRSDSARAGLAQSMRLAAGDPNRVGWTRLTLSFALERDGQLDSAFAEAGVALELARATKDLKLEAYAHDGLGMAHSLRGRYREALAAGAPRRGAPTCSALLAHAGRSNGSPIPLGAFYPGWRRSGALIRLPYNGGPPPTIARRTSGIGGPPNERKVSWNCFHASCPPRSRVHSSRSFRIINLPIV